MKKKNRKGFTIVELVIVIAVIGILAAVLIPTFGNIISNANESAAMQNARNKYTEYLIAHPDADVDYVSDETYTFDVNDDFKKVTGDGNSEKILTIGTCPSPIEEVDGKCGACGWNAE